MIFTADTILYRILAAGSFILSVQGIITLTWMLYAWENPRRAKFRRSPKKYLPPKYSFTALVPMRHEEDVAEDTIKAISGINYPSHLKEVIVICRHDDKSTINKATDFINQLGDENNMVLVLVDTYPINKPLSLNLGLAQARNKVITIFDAEDEPHPELYNIVNTVMQKSGADVVQSGVQLMNYNSKWFSALNVLEYFLWFKSGLSFFTDKGSVAFLGGNSVFFKKEKLKEIGGWDEKCLTEDADVGIRLTNIGAKTKIIYDPIHVTMEETPPTLESFIKQRTRWNQGFLQIFGKGDWLKLPGIKQKLFTLYVLLAPFFPILLLLYLPFGFWVSFYKNVPVGLAMVTYIPFYILSAIIAVQVIAMWEFTRIYRLKFYWYLPFKLVISYFPYMAVLTISAGRSLMRYLMSFNSWEKTAHLNAHRVKI